MERRKGIVFVLVTVLLFAVPAAGCGKKNESRKGEKNTQSAQQEPGKDDNELPVLRPSEVPTAEPDGNSPGKEDTTPGGAPGGDDTIPGGAPGGDGTTPGGTQGNDKEDTMGAATLLYQGHGSIRIVTAEGKTVYIDPFMGDGYDVPADLILITHGHYDHTQTQLIKTKNADCKTISQTEALKGGTHQSFDFGFVKVDAVEAGYNKNHNVKECVGYILTFGNGVKLYVSGDTSKTKDMDTFASKKLDYAFFCCDGVYNMDMAEAIECAKTVGAKHSIPYHMVPANGNGFDRSVAEKFDVEGRIILAPGDELVLE